MTPIVQSISLPGCQQENKSPQCFGDRKTMWWSIEWTAFYRDHFHGRISKISIITELSRLRSYTVQVPLPDLFRCSISDNRPPYSDSVSYPLQYTTSPEPVIGHELESVTSTQSLKISHNDVLPSPWSSTWMLSRKCRRELPVLTFGAYCCCRGGSSFVSWMSMQLNMFVVEAIHLDLLSISYSLDRWVTPSLRCMSGWDTEWRDESSDRHFVTVYSIS
jgi:hypothetical protein